MSGRRGRAFMCGIFQVVERGRPVDEAAFRRALDLIRHRGPDSTGVEIETQTFVTAGGEVPVSIAYGHQRLSILDLGARADQPFRRGDGVMLYNGEIYNFAELKRSKVGATFDYTTSGDTEVLFNLFHRDGASSLRDMVGMWAFTFVDRARGRLTGVKDHFGKKPLFWYADATTFCIGSSIASICAYLGRAPVFDAACLDSFLAHGVMWPHADDTTHFRDIHQVPPGGAVELDLASGTIAVSRWCDMAAYAAANPAEDAALPDLLRSAASLRLVSDRPVGLLLSGGVDSTLVLSVLAAMKKLDGVQLFIGETGRSEDAHYAKLCADALKLPYALIELDYDAAAFERFLRMCGHMEKPFPLLGNSMAMSEMYERIAERDVPVVLDGTGGDEVFGGYWDRTYPFAVREALRRRDGAWLAQQFRTNRAMLWSALRPTAEPDGWLRSAVGRIVPGPSFAIQRFLHADVRAARRTDPLADHSLGFSEALIADMARGRLGEWVLHNDRNAMMASIENRSPLLDHRLIPFAATGYAKKFHDGWNKHELRRQFDAFVPLPTQWRRQKQGFRWHAGQFYARNAARIVDTIAASRVLPDRADVAGFVDAARRNPRYLRSRLGQRFLGVAALEAEMSLRPA
ncbi:MAG: asparagine synthase (glutamine-hydrolyzing) [Labrys sp. (in: a-proteobacteria)]